MIKLFELPVIRSALYRVGRKLYRYARREEENHPSTNGEYWLLDLAVTNAKAGALTMFDVGANMGDWTAQARECLLRHGRKGMTYAFEPTPSTFKVLNQRFWGDTSIRAIPLAVSEEPGEQTFYVVAEMAGTNSLVDGEGGAKTAVQVTTVDAILAEHRIEHVTLLKSDTEGNDLAVLRGGAQSLAEGRVDIWQFEYNHRWVYSRSFLRDVFELIRETPYALGKLYCNGIELFDAWHPELERYFETNFVLIRAGSSLQRIAGSFSFDQSNVAVKRRS
jgi:FkbM family methyltransferase